MTSGLQSAPARGLDGGVDANQTPASPRKWPRGAEWKLLGLILALFLLRNLPLRLDDYDQAKQAFTSLEMVKAGHWWFQHTPGYRLVATKPPLVGWMSAALLPLAGGNWELAWRLPSLLGALVILGALWRAGEAEWPDGGGALAAGAFGLNLLTPRLATLVRTDMMLCAWITLAGLLIWRQTRRGVPWGRRERWEMFCLVLAAMMTKGPILYAFLLPGVAVHAWVCRRRGEASLAWGGWAHWLLPLAPFLLWVQRGIVTVPPFYHQVVAHEFLGRFTVGEAAVHQSQPLYFYFPHLLLRWAPWSVLFLAVRFLAPGVWRKALARRDTLWLVCWVFGGLVFFSLVPSKRVDRIFPVLPPLCLLLTALLARVEPGTARRLRKWSLRAGAAAAAVCALGSAAISYRKGAGNYAAFAARVRNEVGAAPVELISMHTGKGSDAPDETMLVALRRLEFLRPLETMQRIRTDGTRWLVLREAVYDQSRGVIDPSGPWTRKLSSGGKPNYLLLAR